jgi:hypothetical protein
LRQPLKTRLLGVAAAIVLPAAVLFFPRDPAPTPDEVEEVRLAVEMAEAAGSELWASEALTIARREREQALMALSSQRGRLPLFRSYAVARSHLETAGAHARRADEESRAARQAAGDAAGARLLEARAALDAAQAMADAAHLQAEGRRALRQAEILLAEAERRLARGLVGEAEEMARQVIGLGRDWEQRGRRLLERFNDPDSLRRWNRWVLETVQWSRTNEAPALVVDKAERALLVYDLGELRLTLRVDLGLNPVPDKIHEGDNATPEGKYRVAEVREPGQTTYHRALLIDYPNSEDWEAYLRAREEGRVPESVPIGGLIEIHGRGGRQEDWTNGCIAVTDEEMDILAALAVPGTPVTIVGARRPQELPGLASNGEKPEESGEKR